MPVPVFSLSRQYASLKAEIESEILAVMDSGQFIQGPWVKDFEKAFAPYCGSKFCVGVNSGTDALVLILRALDIGKGDEVITVSHTFFATVEAVLHTGATPVLVDVDPFTLLMAPGQVEKAVTPRTKAILPVHLYGQPGDWDALSRMAESHGLYLLEDSAQAQGARYKGRLAGSLGFAAGFSFYPGKNLGAAGDAGAITTSDPDLYARLCRLRDHGAESKYSHVELGWNSRLDSIQAAILSVKLKRLDAWNLRRREIAVKYRELLRGLPGLRCVEEGADREGVYHQFVVLAEERDRLKEYLQERGIGTALHYPVPVHESEAWRRLGFPNQSLPVTEEAARTLLSLPMFPELTDVEVEEVGEAIREYARE